MVQSPCLQTELEVGCQRSGASLGSFLVPLFFLEDGLAPPVVPPLFSGSVINFVVVLG